MHIFKEVRLHQILMTATSVTKATFNLCNQAFTVSCKQKPAPDSPLNNGDFNIDVGVPTFPTKIIFFGNIFCL